MAAVGPSLSTDGALERLVETIIAGDAKAVSDFFAAKPQADVNVLLNKAQEKCTPLYLACAEGHEGVVLALLERGADINKPSMVEMKDEFDDVVSALAFSSTYTAAGGKKLENELPLDAATYNRNLSLSILLLDRGSKVTAKSAARLRKVKKLDLSGKGLTMVPAWLEEFKGLRKLYLSDNKLTSLPPFLANIKLDKLDISNNPLESIPSEVKEGSLKGLFVYLRQLAKSQAKWARIKLMLVGKENVGKTTLLHCLTTLLHNPKAAKKSASDLFAATAKGKKVPAHLRHMPLSTDGIGMGELSTSAWVSTRRKGKTEPVTFQTYDFGGQMVFYPTHQLFLTARSIYLVVFNVVEHDRNHVLYWLKQVRASTKGLETPIIVVGTHIDHPDCPDPQTLSKIGHHLQCQESNVRKVCYVSCKSGDGLEELMEAIIDLSERHSFLKQFIPGSYYTLHRTLINLRSGKVQVESPRLPPAVKSENESENEINENENDKQRQAVIGPAVDDQAGALRWTTWEHLVQLASGCGIDSEELVEVVRFLYDAGTLVHFDDSFGGLQDLVVIDPQWLADVMKSIISFNNKWVKDGAITQGELYNWAWRDYPASIRPALQRIFEKFQIIFPLRVGHMPKGGNDAKDGEAAAPAADGDQPAGRKFMVPSLLPEDPSDEVLAKAWPAIEAAVSDKGESVTEYGRIYELSDFIPIGLFARLIVRVLHIPGVRLVTAWRTGLVVEVDPSRAELSTSSTSSSTTPATYQALVRQLDKPENKIEVLVRVSTRDRRDDEDDDEVEDASQSSHVKGKDKKTQADDSVGVSATTDSIQNSAEQKLSRSVLHGASSTAERGDARRKQQQPIYLLEQIIYLIDVLLQGYNGLEVSRKIPCILPFPDCDRRHCSHLFTYAECVESVMLGRNVECPVHGSRVSVLRLAPDLAIGSVRVIEEQELRRGNQIGRGGYGLVYKASWNNTPVALKLLLTKNECEDEKEKEKEKEARSTRHYDEFKHEAFLMSCLEHEHVIRLYGICYNPLGMVMEFAGRGDLQGLLERHLRGKVIAEPYSLETESGKDKILPLKPEATVIVVRGEKKREKNGLCMVETMYGEKGYFPCELLDLGKEPLADEQIPWALRWRIALDVAKGMQYLHSFQPPIVHRDLRSPNVFLASTDPEARAVAKVGDFGLARHVDPRLHEGLPTWQWLAPEILDSDVEYDERSDIYSYGIVLYEIASRMLPYTEEYWERFNRNGHFQPRDCINAIVKDQCRPTPPSDCPPEFAKLMKDCWAHNPSDRPSFAQVVQTISTHLGSSFGA